MKHTLISLALLASTPSLYSSCTIDVQLFKDDAPLEKKSGPVKSGSSIKFDEGVEVMLLDECADYVVVKVQITNNLCPMSSGKNRCSACDCCNGCEVKCPDACKDNGCCEQECCDGDANTYDVPYDQTLTIKCPSCQYSLQLTITNQH
jgi:hypothetical protein